ncbi:hypothetical protein N9104_01780, partial [Pseudomonadales bacterium]|nr:hypothetical protein [Pseudomonadales bacterium]
ATLPTGIKGKTFQMNGYSKTYTITNRVDDNNATISENWIDVTVTAGDYSLFGDRGILYYTYQDSNGNAYPESWPPDYYLPINPDDGDEASGLGIARDYLMAFKKRSTTIVSGTNHDDLQYYVIDKDVGCISPGSISQDANGDCIFMSERGISMTDGRTVWSITDNYIRSIFTGQGDPPWTVNHAQLPNSVGEFDFQQNRYLLFLASSGSSVLDKMLVFDFNMINGQPAGWYDGGSIYMQASGYMEDGNGNLRACFGCNGGTADDTGIIYYFDADINNDGAGSGTIRGTADATSTTTVIDDTSATFDADILGCWCYIISGTNEGERRRITVADAATQFTVESAFTAACDATTVYAIGAIEAFRKSKHEDFGSLGWKTIDQIRLAFTKEDYDAEFKIYQDFSTTATLDKDISLDKEGGFYQFRRGVNRARHFQYEIGRYDTDRPLEIKQLELTYRGRGKPEDLM